MGRSSKGVRDDSFGTRIVEFSRRTKTKLSYETAASHGEGREREKKK